MVDYFDINVILDFIEDDHNDFNSITRYIEGYIDKNMEIRLKQRILKIKKLYYLGNKFKENSEKGKRKGKRYYYFEMIKKAHIDKNIPNVKALIDVARIDFKVNNASRQTIWRLKKELLRIGVSSALLEKLSTP